MVWVWGSYVTFWATLLLVSSFRWIVSAVCLTQMTVALQDISPWVILMRFSTVDSASSVPAARLLWTMPSTKQYPLIQPAPWVLFRKCVCVLGGGGGGLLVVIIYKKWEQEWTAVGGATEMPHFSEWNYSISIPSLLSPQPLGADTWLVEPPSHWRQAGSLVDVSARKSIHSASHKRSGEIEEEEEGMQETPSESLAQLWWKSAERCHTQGLSSLFKPVPSITPDSITTSPSFGSYERRQQICCKGITESCESGKMNTYNYK